MRLISRSRVSLGFLPVVLLVAALLAVGSASAASKTVNGSVGPGFTISLTKGGKKVTKLKPATYKFKISDKSSHHNFHLSGPGYNKAITSVGFKGRKSVTIKLRKGTYRFMCDPHSSIMKGSFKVG
ncbi:MAG TPA: plastocyanin/azurin family copper-binding protein [Thermoleophilaceae bacterium]